MRILVTRPKEDAEDFAAALAARGIETVIEPLLSITPVADPAIDLDGVQAVLFTSANGVRCFATAVLRRNLRVFTVGDGSAGVARSLGFADVTSAGGDVDSLAALVRQRLQPRDGALLHAAGASLAGDLKGQLEAAGFTVRRSVLYDAMPADELTPATLMNLRLGGIDAIALFSPRSARTFAGLWRKASADGNMGGDGVTARAGLGHVTALCLSAAVAREIGELGWQRIETALRPDAGSLLALAVEEKQRRDAAMSGSQRENGAQDATADATAAAAEASAHASAASDAAAGAAIVAAMPAPPRRGSAGPVLLGLVAGALAGGAMVVAEPYWRPYLPIPAREAGSGAELAAVLADVASLKQQLAATTETNGTDLVDSEARQRIDRLQAEIAEWRAQLASAGSGEAAGPATQPPPADTGAIEARLAAIESQLAAITATAPETAGTPPEAAATQAPGTGADLDTLRGHLAELDARIAGLGDAPARLDALSADAASQKAELESARVRLEAVASLSDRLAALEAETKSLGDGLNAVSAHDAEVTLKRQRAAALVLAIGQLRGVLATDAPFSAELGALVDLARADPEITATIAPVADLLKPQAATGAPTLSELQASLPATAIAQAASADAAGAALGVESGWLQKTLSRLSELITIRPVGDVPGEGSLAHLARAEAKLGAGDLAGAAAEIDGLSGSAAAAAAAWRRDAAARLAQDDAGGRLAAVSAGLLAPDQSVAPSN